MNYICLIKSKESKELIQIPMTCREYHAKKLDYVLGRVLCGFDHKIIKSSRFLTPDELFGMTRTENEVIELK